MEKVYIVAAKRTPTGSFLGHLKSLTAAELGASLVQPLLKQSGVDGSLVDEVIMGHILPAGTGQGLGRQVVIKGGLAHTIPGYSINMACGSAMKAIIQGVQSIQLGQAACVLAGGTESMSKAPFLTGTDIRSGKKLGDFKLIDHMVYDALTDAFHHVHMGITAENIAEKYAISRHAQDSFAFASQQKAIQAIDQGLFKEEIVPLSIKDGKNVREVDTDEYVNRTTNLEKLAMLKPAFKEAGTVTAGNASGLNDGASMVMLVSESFLKHHQLVPLVEIVGYGQAGVDPLYMGLGPTPAVKRALEATNLSLKEIELIEINEAFAAQTLGVVKELSENFAVEEQDILAKLNVNGGAIALGHAVGSSGARISISLLYEMKRRQATYGLATLCIGGGMGIALVLKGV